MTRPSRSAKNQGEEPGPATAVPSAAAARSIQSLLARQDADARANAAVSIRASDTRAARRTPKGALLDASCARVLAASAPPSRPNASAACTCTPGTPLLSSGETLVDTALSR